METQLVNLWSQARRMAADSRQIAGGGYMQKAEKQTGTHSGSAQKSTD